jgi:hypothetical protein
VTLGAASTRIGPMFGLARASPDVTFTWMVEYVLKF